MQEMNMVEVDEVSGGVVPVALYALYVAGGTAGVAAAWQFGRALFCDK